MRWQLDIGATYWFMIGILLFVVWIWCVCREVSKAQVVVFENPPLSKIRLFTFQFDRKLKLLDNEPLSSLLPLWYHYIYSCISSNASSAASASRDILELQPTLLTSTPAHPLLQNLAETAPSVLLSFAIEGTVLQRVFSENLEILKNCLSMARMRMRLVEGLRRISYPFTLHAQ